MDNLGIFDTHAHLDDERFDNDREELIQSLPLLGISRVVNVGADMKTSQNSVILANKYEHIYAAVGVHPHDSKNMTDGDLNILSSYAQNNKKVVAIGEIGLDYHYDNSPNDVQKKRFCDQMSLAIDLRLPVILHLRDAYEDSLEIMKYFGKLHKGGVVHCFGGSLEFANEVLKLGYKIGVGGVVTFSNAKKLVKVVSQVSLDNILTETDCPYMAPTPHRGERNEPSYTKLVVQKIAEIKGLNVDFVIKATYSNANAFFGIE